MTEPARRPDPVSAGGWSGDVPGAPGPHAQAQGAGERSAGGEPHHPAEDRYLLGGRIGEGGMGVVDEVFDRSIGRKVARKRTRHPDLRLEARLRREIEVLGSLQHPGIVPLLDAGTDAAGRPWYTMPKLVGRTLKQELAQATGVEQHQALLRPLLAVCEAVAYAHERGLVHRDLKPANVLLGDAGQVVVLDWGLARREGAASQLDLADQSDTKPAAGNAPPAQADLTKLGDVMGTPRYMSPEQAGGGRIGKPGDVFALGVMLYQVGFGVPLAVRDGVIADEAWAVNPAPAPAYLALLKKCLAHASTDRYADAGALARDLGRFVDGRRVHAHEYSTTELVQRFVAKHRLAIMGTVAGLLTLGVLGVVGVSRLRAESDARLQAQLQTKAALSRADLRLHNSLAAQALTAARAGADPQAESLALGSLELGESPIARGVLATVQGQSASVELGPAIATCTRAEFFPAALAFACVHGGRLSVHSFESVEPVASVKPPVREFLTLDPHHFLLPPPDPRAGVHTWGLSGPPPGGVLHGYSVTAPSVGAHAWAVSREFVMSWQADRAPIEAASDLSATLCGDEGHLAGLTASEQDPNLLFGRCKSGSIFRLRMPDAAELHGGLQGPKVEARASPSDRSTTLVAGRGASRDLLFLGTLDGGVLPLDALTLAPAPGPSLVTGLANIREIVVEPSGTRLALRDDFGRVELIDHRSAHTRLRLPGDGAQAMAFDEAGRLLVARDKLERWTLPDKLLVKRRDTPEGLASLTVSHDGVYLAAAGGDGHITLWRHDTPTPLWRSRWQTQVAKDCAFAPHDDRLVCVAVSGGPRLWQVPGVEPLEIQAPRGIYRRVAWLGDELRLLGYFGAVHRFSDTAYLGDAPGVAGDWKDVGSAPDANGLARINLADGAIRIERLRPGAAPDSHVVAHRPGAVAVDMGPDGELALAGPGRSLEMIEPDGRTRWSIESPASGRLLDVEISHDGLLIAASTVRGALLVWDDKGELRARIRGHSQRAVKLVFASDDSALWSAGWDGSVRRWNMNPVKQSDALPASQWGVPLSEAIASQGL